jgi:hypothetical protein
MTQKQLADAMTARGWKWSQTTVHTVEQGKRPLRLSESEDVLEILAWEGSLTGDDEGVEVAGLIRELQATETHLLMYIEEFLNDQFALELATSSTKDEKLKERVRFLLSHSPEKLVHSIRASLGMEADEPDYEGIPNVKYSEAP